MRRWCRWIIRVALVVIAGLAAGAAWLAGSATPGNGTAAVPGLTAAVTVLRDDHGVPHIFAGSKEDATAALGFAHAEDRLWQMETTRRLGAGRLAEVLGPAALPSDRWMRTLGLYRLAEQQYPQLLPATRRLVDAYTRGVNAYLEQRSGPLPPEFLVLRFRPEAWQPADSLVWLKLMALRLSTDRRDELLRMRLQHTLSPEQLQDLWPEEPAGAPTTLAADAVPEVSPRSRAELAQRSGPGPDADRAELPPARSTSPAPPPAPRPPAPGVQPKQPPAPLPDALAPAGSASNAWVVAGMRTASGKPILANDPHLSFTLPQPWYLARLVFPGGELVGATAPGFPAMILGHNGSAAWGITSSDIDVEDVFVEQVAAQDPLRYHAPGGMLPFGVRTEQIAVRGAESEALAIRATRHGPVISGLPGVPPLPAASGRDGAAAPDASDAAGKAVLALAATYLLPDDRTPDALFALNQAASPAAFLDAARLATAPQQNVFYADVNGHIGFIAAGRVPLRDRGCGWLPSQGADGRCDWSGFLPFEALPQAIDPPSGVLINANNRPVPPDDPRSLPGSWDVSFRAERIAQLVEGNAPQSVQETAAHQHDRLSLMARHLLPIMLKDLPDAPARRAAVALLREWSGEMAQDQPAPLVFVAWLRALVRALFADELGSAFSEYWAARPRAVERALTQRPAWCDDVRSADVVEDCASQLAASLDQALAELMDAHGADPGSWRWGDAHQARFVNLFWQRIPVLRDAGNIARAMDGGDDTLNRSAMRFSDAQQPFAGVHGGGFRAVYDLADLQRSRLSLAAGQSGNPLARNYRNLMQRWLEGDDLVLGQPQAVLQRDGTSIQHLVPAAAADPPEQQRAQQWPDQDAPESGAIVR